MTRIIGILIILVCLSNGTLAQRTFDLDHEVINTLSEFVDSTEAEINLTDHQFLIYVAYVYPGNGNGETCITFSYIMNSADYGRIRPTQYFALGSSYVLVCSDLLLETTADVVVSKLQLLDHVRMAQRLYPTVLGGFSYEPKFLELCRGQGNQTKNLYSNPYEVNTEGFKEVSFYGKMEIKVKHILDEIDNH